MPTGGFCVHRDPSMVAPYWKDGFLSSVTETVTGWAASALTAWTTQSQAAGG